MVSTLCAVFHYNKHVKSEVPCNKHSECLAMNKLICISNAHCIPILPCLMYAMYLNKFKNRDSHDYSSNTARVCIEFCLEKIILKRHREKYIKT